MKKLLLLFAIATTFQFYGQTVCWQDIKFGSGYAIAIKSNGTLWAWGTNSIGQLGDGTTIDKSSPIQVGTDTDWKSIATGQATTIALKNNGTIWEWGDNFYGQITEGNNPQTTPLQIGTATGWKSVSTGGNHVLALKNNGTLWVWGSNSFGSLGLGNTQDVSEPVQLGTATDWKIISTGAYSSYAIKNNGTLWAWGWNNLGQIGIGTTTGNDEGGPDVLVPTQVGNESNWANIDAGGQFAFAQKNDNTLWSWGSNVFGELGDGTTTGRSFPLQMGTDTWTSFTAGNGSCNGTKEDGTLYMWGFYMGMPVINPTQIGIDTNWRKAVSSWQGYSLSVKTNNDIYVLGENNVGQLGLGDTNQRIAPALFGNMCEEQTAGINNNTLTHLSIYPNPTSGILYFANTGSLTINAFTVTDLTGNTVITQQGTATQLNVQQLPSGMYFLAITTDKGTINRKFIKE